MSPDTARNESNAAIFAEAAGWLVDFREGCVDAEGRRRFYAWLRRSPEHIQAYMEAAALWGDIPRLAAGMSVDVEALIANARAQNKVTTLTAADMRASGRRHLSVLSRSIKSWALAAALATAIVGGVFMTWWHFARESVYATAIGEQRSITLIDGSTVELGVRSRIHLHVTDKERDVELLEGQALFRVVKDTARPFVVDTRNARVRAIGTQFDVHQRTSGTTVTVLEGRVAVHSLQHPSLSPEGRGGGTSTTESPVAQESVRSSGPNAILVGAGQQVTVSESVSAGSPRPHPIDVGTSTALAEHTLTFDNAALSDVVEEFNRYNRQQIVLSDPALESLRISGVFAATKPNSLLRFLSDQMSLEVVPTSDQINISPAKNK